MTSRNFTHELGKDPGEARARRDLLRQRRRGIRGAAFGDCIKPEAARFVAERKRRGRLTLLVSGDGVRIKPEAARFVAELKRRGMLTAGLSRRVRIKPEAARFIVERKRRGMLTLLVSGDGVRHYRVDGGQNRRG